MPLALALVAGALARVEPCGSPGGGYDTSARTTFEVDKELTTPAIGGRRPAVDTPTIADVSTDSDPSRWFYRLFIAEALQAGRPAVVVAPSELRSLLRRL